MPDHPDQPDSHSGGSNGARASVATQSHTTIPLEHETHPAPQRIIEPQPGQELGPVRLVRELGRGAMGVVFLGHHKLLDRPVAVKFVNASRGGSEGHARFFEEAKAAAAVRHAHLTEIYHADVAIDVPYLVLEFVDGPTLSQLLHHTTKLPLRTTLSIVSEIAEAVAELHDQGIVHRDLKPSNVLLDRSGRVLVTDFGLAVRRDPTAGLTNTDAPAGTPAYMAPEMFEGRVSPRSDIYALGILMFQALVGKVPFEGTFEDLRQKHQTEPLPLEKLREAAVPDNVIDIVERATHKQLMFRYKTAHELGRAIIALGGDVAEIAKAKSELRATILSLKKGEAAPTQSSSQGSSTRPMQPQDASSTNPTYSDTIARAAEQKRQRMKTLLESEPTAAGDRNSIAPPPVMFAEAQPTAQPQNSLWTKYQTPSPTQPHVHPAIAITIACVVAIIIGGAGILWCVIQWVLGSEPAARSTSLPDSVRAWQLASLLASLILSAALIISAIAALALKPRGRTLLLTTSVAELIFQPLSLIVALTFALPRIRLAAGAAQPAPFITASGLLHVVSPGLIAVKAVLVCAAMAAILLILTRRNVKSAFIP